ncbi:TonB-dependent receptor [Taibaiella soli]|uniref:TonB-dependent receptor n=1 Tax=Taibaiella soli TaxID=1649169 RepID=A0A2W2ADW6_9BACT|nr:TonB-dependent receptor [Taibaiella soli]PZF71742.1 hypothetical protein DN068_16890 [Taibaiella soli]
MKAKHISLYIALLAISGSAAAQKAGNKDTTIKSTTIEVIQSYKPVVKQAPKPEFAPALPPADTSRPAYTYTVPAQTLFFTYHSLPLKPLALGKDTTHDPFANYIKFGLGNLKTIYLDAGIGSLKGENFATAIHVHHLSQSGNIDNQNSAQTGLEAEGTLYKQKNNWHAGFEGYRNQYSWYGYNHDLVEYTKSDVQQIYYKFGAEVDMYNNQPLAWGLNYHPEVSAGVFTANNVADGHKLSPERSINLNVPFSKDFDTSFRIQLGLVGKFAQLSVDDHSVSNNYFQVTPAAFYHKNNFSANLGLYPTFAKNITYLLPDIGLHYTLPSSQIGFGAGWSASLIQNTFEQLATKNPYISITDIYNNNGNTIRQTRTDELYGSAQTNIGHHITVSARLSWWTYRNLPMFMNNYSDEKQFSVLYENKVNAISLQANLRYQISNNFAVGFSGTWYNFYNSTGAHVWQEPGVRLRADLMFRPIPKLTITAYTYVLDHIYAVNTNNESTKLKGVFDLGGGAEYQIIPRLSVFLQINNLLNNANERWLGYTSYGFNIFGGIRFKF